MAMLLACGVFALSAAVIVFAGTKSTRYGNRIADETGLGGLWIGVVLMASATGSAATWRTCSSWASSICFIEDR